MPDAPVDRTTPMDRAFAEAEAAAARGEVPVGAAISCPHRGIVASAGNRTLEWRDPTAHAEMIAIREACRVLGSERLPGCDIYVTLEPCTMCAAATAFARLRRLYFAADDPKAGAVENGVRFFAQATCHHAPEVYGGISQSRARALMQDFFRRLRA